MHLLPARFCEVSDILLDRFSVNDSALAIGDCNRKTKEIRVKSFIFINLKEVKSNTYCWELSLVFPLLFNFSKTHTLSGPQMYFKLVFSWKYLLKTWWWNLVVFVWLELPVLMDKVKDSRNRKCNNLFWMQEIYNVCLGNTFFQMMCWPLWSEDVRLLITIKSFIFLLCWSHELNTYQFCFSCSILAVVIYHRQTRLWKLIGTGKKLLVITPICYNC
jgi:hypothetical protein